jgi:hypothetical protein
MEEYQISYIDATDSLALGKYKSCTINGEIVWKDDATDLPTGSELQAEITRLQAEFDALAYARNRQAEYPDYGTQLNKIYDDGLTKWKVEMVDPVKSKWPKDNSGPK